MRNDCCAKFCPMYAFQFFSSTCGQGEIVGLELSKGADAKFVPHAGTVKVWTWVDALLKLSGLPLATPHSIRASACIWALRCYVDPDYVKEGGRW
eukprot:5944110-Prymnesium_polylepis.1